MDPNGKPGVVPGAPPITLSGGNITVDGHIDRMTLCGAVNGQALYTMELTSFGGADPIPFLAAVIKAIHARRSGLVIPHG